jgi:hypothetical protein
MTADELARHRPYLLSFVDEESAPTVERILSETIEELRAHEARAGLHILIEANKEALARLPDLDARCSKMTAILREQNEIAQAQQRRWEATWGLIPRAIVDVLVKMDTRWVALMMIITTLAGVGFAAPEVLRMILDAYLHSPGE